VEYAALTPEAQLALAEYAERCKGNTLASVASIRLPAYGPLLPMRDRYE
jgi:hypothetical protein